MSRTVDSKVVEMQFDNQQFERGVRTSLGTLEKLKQGLNLDGAAKGLENFNSAARGFNISPLANGIETVRAKFSALEVMAVTTLANITNSAVNAGKRMISALTIDPIKTGFQEYETQINAVQTILANTSSKGTTITDVNKALDELNAYADKTIYNFTEMTRNIGTFTAAGIDLKTSTSAIQGIANLAAVSGSTSQQASTAMYQLSQALSSGTVKLQDWNSVVNAGMGGQVFQDALKKTAEVHGVNVDAMIKKEGSFRESLKNGWITADILTETLSKMTKSGAAEYLSKLTGVSQEQIEAAQKEADATGKADEAYKKIVKSMEATGKITAKEATEILKMADTAEDAATKVKTFTQLWDTLKEAAQSGWTQSWEILVGDFEEAKELLTSISDVISKVINDSAEARNKLLQGWKDDGGRDDLIQSFKNASEGLMSVVKPIQEAFREIFPPLTVKQLTGFTEGLKNLTERLKASGETVDKIKRTFKGLFSIVDILRKAFLLVAKVVAGLIGPIADLLLSITAPLGDMFTSINEGFNTEGISKAITNLFDTVGEKISGIKKLVSIASEFISNAAVKLWGVLKNVFGWIGDNVSFGDIFAGLAGGGIFVVVKKVCGLLDKFKDKLGGLFGDDGEAKVTKFRDILNSLRDSLDSFSTGIKVSSIVAIAVAVGILSASMKTISELNVPDIAKSLTAIGLMLTMLTIGFKSVTKSLSGFDSKGLIKAGLSMVLMAAAIKIMADALTKMASLSFEQIAKGLVAMGVGLAELCGGLKIIGKTKIPLKTSVAMIALAEACKILGDALAKFGSLSWSEIARGLAGMGGALLELTGVMAILKKVGGFKSLIGSLGILIVVQSLSELADDLKKFGEMTWSEIARGLSGMGGALAEVAVCCGALGKLGGFSSLFGAGAIMMVVQGLGDLADAMKKLGEMTWSEIARGLAGMGGALLEVSAACGLLGGLIGFAGLFGAGAIMVVIQGLGDMVDALMKFGGMTWDEIARGLVGMGGALTEVSAACGLLGGLTGFASLFGAGAIWTVVQGLGDLADAFKKFGEMNWDEIKHGLVAMGGALGETALGGLMNTLSGLGAASIEKMAAPLGTLADSVKKWKDVTVPGGLGFQLSRLAAGVLSFTYDGLGANAIASVAAPLGTLADSVKRWSGVTVPEGLSDQLFHLADGVSKFTFSGLGGNAIASCAGPLGVMADSVKKWSGVTVPENLGDNLTMLSDGVKSFSWAFMGGWSMDTIIDPLSRLPDAVGKWNNVQVPEGLKDNLTNLSDGVKSFSWAFMGGWSMDAVVGPLGDLAASVKKWNGISIPEGLGAQLAILGDGVKAFTWAKKGGNNIDTVAAPLGILADSIKKLAGVSIPDGIGDQFSSLAAGVKEFTWASKGSDNIATVAAPLGTMADSVKKLSAVAIPEDFGTKLKSVASGVKEFNSTSEGGSAMGTTAASMEKLAEAISRFVAVQIPVDLGDKLKMVAQGALSFSGVNAGSMIAVANALSSVGTSANKVSSVNSDGINSAVDAIKKLGVVKIDSKNISSSMTSIVSATSRAMKSMQTAITSSKASINSAMKSVMNGLTQTVKSSTDAVKSAASSMSSEFAKAILSKKAAANSAGKALVTETASGIKSNRSSFESAGEDLGNGLVIGINSKQWAAYIAGYNLGKIAVQGEKDGQRSNSPSKATIQSGKWFGEGLVIGIDKMGRAVYNAGHDMGETAVNSLSSAISQISGIVNSDIDNQPTIRPVLDLSDVSSGVNALGGMFDMSPSIGVMANVGSISSMMNQRQNGANDDVISAIKDLGRSIGGYTGDTYNINGVTYDDGTNISNAVQTLVRAARVERRI